MEHLCYCKRPENPDRELVQCGNPDCAKWLHRECIEQTAKEATLSELAEKEEAKPLNEAATIDTSNGSVRTRRKSSTPRGPRKEGNCLQSKVEVHTTLLIPDEGSPKLRLTLRSAPGSGGKGVLKEWETPVHCLLCGEVII